MGTSIVDVFDAADGELLILGEGGAGKSTLLLELARDLVGRARQDDTHPIPVIFHLASWKPQQLSLAAWLVEELNTKYQIPRRLAAQWIEQDQILPLLDGLDESSAQGACIEAVNHYRQDHGLVNMVVCSRTNDYLSQPARLILSSAVMVQPLSENQIEAYLAQSSELVAMKVALKHDADLRELCSTPLMLSILASTYAGMTVKEVSQTSSSEGHRSALFDRYVERLLRRRPSQQYSDQKVMKWLGWLAWYMRRSGQTEIYLERLQPEWALHTRRLTHYQSMIIRLIYGIQAIAISGSFAWLRGGRLAGPGQENIFGVGAGLLGQLGSGPGNKIFGWMAPGLGGGLDASGSLGIFLSLLLPIVILLAKETLTLSWKAVWRGIFAGGRAGLLFGIPIGIIGMPFFFLTAGNVSLFLKIIHALSFGTSVGIFCGLILGFQRGLLACVRVSQDEAPQTKTSIQRTWSQKFGDTIILGCLAGGAFGLVDIALHVVASTTITFTLIVVGVGMGFGGGNTLIPGLASAIRPAEIVSWSFSGVKRDFGQNIVKGVTIGSAIMLSAMLVLGGGSALFNGLVYGFRFGLVCGLMIGLITSVTAFFTATLKSGWTSNMLSEHYYSLSNEGIKRSLRHGLLAGGIFGLVGGLASGFVAGGAFGLVGGLSGGYVLGMDFAIIFSLIFALEFGLLHGLIAVIEHYVLRWYLYRADLMPLNMVGFLNEAAERMLIRKIGGGYMFFHYDFLNYFAQTHEEALKLQPEKMSRSSKIM
ncbi:hypothetical protein KSC_068610 [Ktedonobacter sp. SOSP1-52]|nr:hypothetical protein KSC_068610 [Ktedonobacter sp. SOSP1-52]